MVDQTNFPEPERDDQLAQFTDEVLAGHSLDAAPIRDSEANADQQTILQLASTLGTHRPSFEARLRSTLEREWKQAHHNASGWPASPENSAHPQKAWTFSRRRLRVVASLSSALLIIAILVIAVLSPIPQTTYSGSAGGQTLFVGIVIIMLIVVGLTGYWLLKRKR